MLPLRRNVYAAIAPVWIVLLIAGSLLPYPAKVAMGSRPAGVSPKLPVVTLKHRSFHWLAFGATALLLMMLARNRYQDAAAMLATIALGLSIEYTQHRMYRSRLEWWDVRDDTYAAVASFVVVQFPPVKRRLVR